MKTESHSINDVLAKNATSFFIPPFQRAYAWGKPEIERYFNDVLRIIDSELNPDQPDKLEHFFGTIVIKEEQTGFANKSIVVDGQQRLTTTLIFLIALRDSESDTKKQNYITQNYLTNNASTFQDKIKLKQVTKDWDAYRALVNQTKPETERIISNAYFFFSKLIDENKKINPHILLEHYIKAIQRMNVAVIFLDERPFKGEDPQIIFETLNSLGKPLTLSDLVRNFVLLNMNSEKQAEIYENIWHPKIENILHEKTSEFFRDYLQYKTASSIKVVSDNNTKELYQIFKNFVNRKFKTHKDFIDDIVRYTNWYKWIISDSTIVTSLSTNIEKSNEIKELIRNIFHDIKSEAFKPFVLGLLKYHQSSNEIKLNDDLFISILEIIRTYLIRRRILGLTQGENKNIVLLSNRIEDLAKGTTTILSLLSNMYYKTRFPNDNELEQKLKSMNFYDGLKLYRKFILGKIEEHNTKVSVDYRNSKITVEHIMPQTITDDWRHELGENFESIHNLNLHNIGNLILTEFNGEMGNKSFSLKKEKLNNSSLHYRLDVINRSTWGETSIKEHQKNMISWLLETFPLPDKFKKTDNWNTAIAENTKFSPLDNDAGNIAEGNKPSLLKIEDASIEVSSWQDVFIKFVRYVKNKQNYNFDLILDNQTELFKRADSILKWSELKPLIEENGELKKRYKTLEGKTWDKVKELTDDTRFFHINISAPDCMNRIANIMNQFYMSEDSVVIQLKQ